MNPTTAWQLSLSPLSCFHNRPFPLTTRPFSSTIYYTLPISRPVSGRCRRRRRRLRHRRHPQPAGRYVPSPLLLLPVRFSICLLSPLLAPSSSSHKLMTCLFLHPLLLLPMQHFTKMLHLTLPINRGNKFTQPFFILRSLFPK